jgi:nucleotide-sensitive chloride channel 1A
MISPLNSPPPFITAGEHATLTSSTPSSFADIPPVLRWTDDDVHVSMSPHDGWWEGKQGGKLWVTEEYVQPQILRQDVC